MFLYFLKQFLLNLNLTKNRPKNMSFKKPGENFSKTFGNPVYKFKPGLFKVGNNLPLAAFMKMSLENPC